MQRIGFPDPATFGSTFPLVAGWLDGLEELTGVPIDRTVIGGFSQGTVMSFALGLAAGRQSPAGIVALSGFVPTVEGFELDLAGRAGLPVAIGHGAADPVIGVEWARDARDRFEAAGAAVSYRESPIGHAIDPAFVRELSGWLEAVLSATERPADAQRP